MNAYMAGVIDSRGSIRIDTAKGSPTLRYILISNQPEFLQKLQSNYGGSLTADSRGYGKWDIGSNNAYRLLMDVYPHLIFKKKEVELAIKCYRATYTHGIKEKKRLQKQFWGVVNA